MSTLEVEIVHPHARIPIRAHTHDAGLDLYCCESITVEPGRMAWVDNGVKFGLPRDTWGFLTGRSSSAKRGLLVIHGVIDSDYTGRLYTCVLNVNQDKPVDIRVGDRISQLVLVPNSVLDVDVQWVNKVEHRERGENGFGSTGM